MPSISVAGSSTATYYQPVQATAGASANPQPVRNQDVNTTSPGTKNAPKQTANDGDSDNSGGFDATV